ncbi:hypothetical protein PFISCL1PPCAC_2295, partial [Pristionchus fissidentatus]
NTERGKEEYATAVTEMLELAAATESLPPRVSSRGTRCAQVVKFELMTEREDARRLADSVIGCKAAQIIKDGQEYYAQVLMRTVQEATRLVINGVR